MRRAIAFLVAPLAAVAPMTAVFLLGLLSSGLAPAADNAGVLGAVVPFAIATMAVSYVYTWIAGMPAHYLLQRLGRTTFRDYVLTGAGLTVVPAVLYLTYAAWYEAPQSGVITSFGRYAFEVVRASIVFGSCGASVAGVYWLLNVDPRPGRRAPV